MADKPTTPEPPHAAGEPSAPRRKKRAPPTIDLTATEVPGSSSEPPQAQERAEAADAAPPQAPPSAPAGTARNWLSGNVMAALVAGLVGAAVMLLVLSGLWLGGLLPVRYVESTATGAPDSKAIDALGQRLSKIEDTKPPTNDSAMAERIAAADNAMKALGLALTALNRRSDDVAANTATARERAEAAEKAVTELRASLQDVAKSVPAGMAPAELDELQKRVAGLEQSARTARDDIAKTAATDNAARLALSAAALRDAVASGAPFAAELAQAKSLGGDDKALAVLEPFTASGVPTQSALANELRALLPGMLKASGAQAPAGGFLERLQANAGKLVRIRPIDAPAGDDPAAVLARLEIDAANADVAAALADLGRLPEPTRAPAQGWIAKAQARQAALAAARSFAADTARALGQK